ncbi:MAG: hypothetical protein JF609_04740 [Verrucomicrobia bacterium]|nr:hypothetical protein [Verrucomicrobiota bacterium]
MKALTNQLAIRQFQGFAVHVLENNEVQVAVVPELGAKIISLKNMRTGREWLWHPHNGLRLFRNQPHDDFSKSPLAGIDECLPTIAPCVWRDHELSDHGEVWNHAWQVDADAWQSGVLSTIIRLKTSPFIFRRNIELRDNEVRLDYELANLSNKPEPFVWAMHPLLRLVAGDQLELPESTRQLLGGEDWVRAVATAVPDKDCAKIFASPVSEGWAAIKNEVLGDRLEFAWDAGENGSLGLWLTRGGWHGHHHFAIEPTNANHDSLAVAAVENRCGRVPVEGSINWTLCLRIGL